VAGRAADAQPDPGDGSDFGNDALLAKGKDKEASDLLKGTKESAEKILQLQNEATGNRYAPGSGGKPDFNLERAKGQAAINELHKASVGFTEKEVQAQQKLVEALTAQAGLEERIASLKNIEGANARQQTGNVLAGQQAAAGREAAETLAKMRETATAADHAAAEAQLNDKRASIAERLQVDLDFAERERDIQLAANQQEISALDKSGKDYQTTSKPSKTKPLKSRSSTPRGQRS